MLAAMAAWAIVAPARADVFLSFGTISGGGPNGPPAAPTNSIPAIYSQADVTPATGLTINVGDVRYVAVSLTTNANTPGAVQNFWASSPGDIQLATFGMNMTFDPTIADNPFIPSPSLTENRSNLRIQSAGQGYSDSYPNQPYVPGYRQAVGLSTAGLGENTNFTLIGGPTIPLGVFKVVGVASGTTNFTFGRLTAGPGGAVQNVWQITDGVQNQFLDPEVFSALHQTFSFPVTVLPEPSSMALCGLALVGFGWRKLRRKTPVAA